MPVSDDMKQDSSPGVFGGGGTLSGTLTRSSGMLGTALWKSYPKPWSPSEARPYRSVGVASVPSGMSGLDVQHKLNEKGVRVPIIFITGHGDIPMTVKAMKSGAVDFLTKSWRDQDLVDAIQQALERDEAMRQREMTCETVASA
jgi:DNA-binding NtrC family response regulator